MKTTYLFRFLRLTFSFLILAQCAPSIAQPYQLYYEFYNFDDALFKENQGTISIAADPRACEDAIRERVDYVTAHTATVQMNNDKFLLDEEIILTHFVKQLNCKRLQIPVQQVLNIRVPDLGPPNRMNEEEIIALKVDDDGNVFGVGTYSIWEDSCTMINTPSQRAFYFKYDITNKGIFFLKLITGTGSCSMLQDGAFPVDIEILPNGDYLIALQGAMDGGFMIVDKIDGSLLKRRQITYGNTTTVLFNPVDMEVVGDKIYAIGHYGGIPNGDPTILAMDTELKNPEVLRVRQSSTLAMETHLSAIKYNPESNSLLFAGVSNSSLAHMVVGKIDHPALGVQWVNEFSIDASPREVTMEASFGMDYLHSKNAFAIHAFAKETDPSGTGGGIPGGPAAPDEWYNVIVTIDDLSGLFVDFHRLAALFSPGQENQFSLNNTLVQSYSSDHLAMVLGNDLLNTQEHDNASLFLTERYYKNASLITDCMLPLTYVPIGYSSYGEIVTSDTSIYDIDIDGLDFDEYFSLETYSENRCRNDLLFRESENLAVGNEIEVFPNPASTFATATFPSHPTETMIRIYDQLGRIVHLEEVPEGLQTISFEAGQFQPGLYYINRSNAATVNETATFLIK